MRDAPYGPTPRRLAFASAAGAILAVASLYFWSLWAASLAVAAALGCGLAAGGLCVRERAAHERWVDDHDPATGALRREAFVEALSTRGEERVSVCAVRVLSLDAADAALSREEQAQVIATQARRLDALSGGILPIARLREDTFAFAVVGPRDPRVVVDDASTIVAALSKPVALSDGSFVAMTAAGIARMPEDARDPAQLVDAATSALAAGVRKGTRVHRYEPGARTALRHALDLERALRSAVAGRRLELVYQPIVDSVAGRTLGAEALVRFRHPDFGQVPPASFIPIAERSGLVTEIDRFVLEEASRRVMAWRESLHQPDLFVSVNLSTRQFRDAHLAGFIGGILRDARVDPGAIVLEVTETAALEDLEQGCASVRQLRELGVKVALDDFGTGHCWLSYLSRIEIDRIKIDQAFVRDLHANPRHERICRAMTDLASDLSLGVVAEGVEREEHARCLSAMGVEQLQGYFFAGPLTGDRFAAFAAHTSGEASGTRYVAAGPDRASHERRRQDIC